MFKLDLTWCLMLGRSLFRFVNLAWLKLALVCLLVCWFGFFCLDRLVGFLFK